MQDAGKVITVQGPVEPSSLGVTITHEHLLINCLTWLRPFEHKNIASGAFDRVTPENAAWLRQYPYYSRENMIHTNWRQSADELRRFKISGGGTLVDASSYGCGRDVWALKKIADDVGMHIVAGSGYYVDVTHPWDMDDRDVDTVADELIRDIQFGADGTEIRSGIIGEIGTSDPVTPNEWKVVRAAALAHRETGAVIQIHSLHEMGLMPSIIEALIAEGVEPNRIIACHMDLRCKDWEYTRRVAEYGVYIEYDGFGHPCPTEGVYVSDDDRLSSVERLLEAAYTKRLLFAHDIGLPARMACNGGPGWDHIVNVVVPELRRRGATSHDIKSVMIDNPARALALSRDVEENTRITTVDASGVTATS